MTITAERLARVIEVFEKNFTCRDEIGASISIWQHGNQLVKRSAGWCEREHRRKWSDSTLVPIWSSTKGLASACLLHTLAENSIPLGEKIASIWPEFGAGGKTQVTLEHLLSHRAGLAALDHEIDSFDYAAVIRAIERQAPNWQTGTAHGYHPRTFGFILDEILKRITGAESLGHYWREQFAEPLDLDIWIGLPEELDDRVATLCTGKMRYNPGEEPFYRAFTDEKSLARRSFASPAGVKAMTGMNERRVRRLCLPAMGGIASATALGKFYAILASGGEWRGKTYLRKESLTAIETSLCSDLDKTLQLQTSFGAGFMKDPTNAFGEKRRQLFGPETRAFGHPGAGGSHAFADPENGIAFAYTMNRMGYGLLPDERSMDMVEALYE